VLAHKGEDRGRGCGSTLRHSRRCRDSLVRSTPKRTPRCCRAAAPSVAGSSAGHPHTKGPCGGRVAPSSTSNAIGFAPLGRRATRKGLAWRSRSPACSLTAGYAGSSLNSTRQSSRRAPPRPWKRSPAEVRRGATVERQHPAFPRTRQLDPVPQRAATLLSRRAAHGRHGVPERQGFQQALAHRRPVLQARVHLALPIELSGQR
jgi:hypothetical protein